MLARHVTVTVSYPVFENGRLTKTEPVGYRDQAIPGESRGGLTYWIPKPLKSKEVASGRPPDTHKQRFIRNNRYLLTFSLITHF